jgi:hypothetical protein
MLTEKDKEFMDKLQMLMDSRNLSVELRRGDPSYMVLRGNYGEAIHRTFRLTRQGVRWRFHHIFNQAYVQAFETILLVETAFGPQLRDHAIRMSRERYAARQGGTRRDLRFADSVLSRQRNRGANSGGNDR